MFSLAPFLKSPFRSPDSKVSALGVDFHYFGVIKCDAKMERKKY